MTSCKHTFEGEYQVYVSTSIYKADRLFLDRSLIPLGSELVGREGTVLTNDR